LKRKRRVLGLHPSEGKLREASLLICISGVLFVHRLLRRTIISCKKLLLNIHFRLAISAEKHHNMLLMGTTTYYNTVIFIFI